MENMTPEQRQRLQEQLRARGFDPAALEQRAQGRGAAPASAGRNGQDAAEGGGSPASTNATPAPATFDALFAPLPVVESAGRVWIYVNGTLVPRRVRTGVSDGQNSELLEGDLEEGSEVVTNVLTGSETRPAAPTGAFPGLGRGGFQGGNRGGGGRR
jgi:hypothetical protein